jgi:hypothetical protein
MSPPGSTGSRRRSRSTPCPAVGRGRFLDAWRQGILGAVVEPVHRLPVRSRDQVPVCVHGELDRGVAELGFNARYGLAIDGVTPTVSPDMRKCAILDRGRVDHEVGRGRAVFRVSSAVRRR